MNDYGHVEIRPPLRLLERLRRNEDKPPEKLYAIGDASVLDGPCVAIVGARRCSVYGRAMSRKLAVELARASVTVISGLARGIDTEAHRGCVEMRGRTVAVFGTGIDVTYPAANETLAETIVDAGGLLLSEYGPGVEPAPWRFPARNRIVASLSDAVVVVESRERSGSLITARFAAEYGVPVFAYPGEVGASLSVGTNQLIRDGKARMCLGVDDVLSAIEDLYTKEGVA